MKISYKTPVVSLAIAVLLMLTKTASADLLQDYSAYCVKSGGVVEKMPAEFSTYAGRITGQTRMFCEFNVDNGFIAIGLETFASSIPSIAATYIKKLDKISSESRLWKGASSNPAHNVCKNLGGSEIGFVSNGGFTNSLGESDICVFGDGSMVSGWSLIYMANHREGYDAVKNQVKAEPLSINIPSS